MSLMFAGRSGSTPIFVVSLLAVSIQLFLFLRKSIHLADAPNRVEVVSGRVVLDDKPLPKSSKLWTRNARVAVHKYLLSLPDSVADDRLLQEAQSRSLAARLPEQDCWSGVSEGKDFHLNLASCVHLLIVGPTGSGKSQLLSLILNSLFATRTDQEARVILLDFKGSALLNSIRESGRFAQIIDDLDIESHQQLWSSLQNELEARERYHRDLQRADVTTSPNAPGRLVIVVDELSAVLKSGPKASETLVNLATRGRSLRITLVITNQGLGGIPRELLLNLRTRIALQSTDQVELVQLGGSSLKIPTAQAGWISARMLRNEQAETDFKFPVGA